MQKYLLNIIHVMVICLLAGCQTSTLSVGQAFNSFSNTSQNGAEAVQEALGRSIDPQVAQVHAEMYQDKIVLSGYVKKIRQSDTAEQIAHQVSGNQVVENRIIVKP